MVIQTKSVRQESTQVIQEETLKGAEQDDDL